MVTRKALLIGNSGGYRGLNYLKGVSVDLNNYKHYLTTKAGGQWHNHEIVTLTDPDTATVLNAIQQAKADYSFVTFSGHGFISTYTNSDYVCLKDGDLSIGKLVTPSPKQTLVIDACRNIVTQVPEDLTKSFVNEMRLQADGIDTRLLFDEAIQQMATGVLVVYSTQPNQSAGDDAYKGGHFTYSFIEGGRQWWNSSINKGILRIDSAVKVADRIMKATFITTQTPEMGGQVRRLTFPPFAFAKR